MKQRFLSIVFMVTTLTGMQEVLQIILARVMFYLWNSKRGQGPSKLVVNTDIANLFENKDWTYTPARLAREISEIDSALLMHSEFLQV